MWISAGQWIKIILMGRLKEFMKTAIKDYRVGALAPTSQKAARRIVGLLKPGCRYLIEYGPGNGAVTRAILERLPPTGQVVAIEINLNFARSLQTISDRRLRVIAGDALEFIQRPDIIGLPQVETIISGIPFSFLKPARRQEIIQNTRELLTKDGLFLVYQLSPLILPTLKQHFRRVRVAFEPRNFLPYFIMAAEK